MTHILFVCHGNICRSPMAEFIMKALIRKAGCEKAITVDSVAATTEEIGNDMYPPAKRMLTKKGIPFSPRRARLITASDYARADYLLCMDVRRSGEKSLSPPLLGRTARRGGRSVVYGKFRGNV